MKKFKLPRARHFPSVGETLRVVRAHYGYRVVSEFGDGTSQILSRHRTLLVANTCLERECRKLKNPEYQHLLRKGGIRE